MSLQTVYQTRTVNHEDKGELLNVAQLTLTNAAVAANEPIRKQEHDAAIAALSFDNVVESVETSLTDYIAANGTGLAEGTLLILNNAPERENRFVRRDPLVSDVGDENDFININAVSNFIRSDLTDQYSGADGLFIDDTNGFIGINDGTITLAKLAAEVMALVDTKDSDVTSALTGDAATYTNLGLVEDELESLTAETSTHSKTIEYAVAWGAADGNGISTATIDTSTDFGTKSVQVRILKDLGDGYFEHISTGDAVEVSSNTTSVRLRTDSGALLAATLSIEVTGTPAV